MTIYAARKLTFQEALTQIYLERPCQVLPNALWKTRRRLDDLEVDFVLQEDRVSQLAIWGPRELYTFWSRTRLPMDFPFDRYSEADFLLVHQDFISTVNLELFADRKHYFRLSYSGASMPQVPAGWRVREVAREDETESIAEFIRHCYPGSQLSSEIVQKWETYPVHDPSLWLWVEDAAGKAMGLGIAEFDKSIGEGSLEWVQVLPEYRRRGVGQAVVSSLVRRLRPQSQMITVSGQTDSETRPDLLYRKCGFVGDDCWWVLRKNLVSI